MKILYYSAHPNLRLATASGPGTHMREVIKAFEENGHEVQTLIMGDYGREESLQSTQTASRGGLRSKIKPFIPAYLWQTLKDRNLLAYDRFAASALDKAVQSFQPDLIYERGYFLMTSGIAISKAHEIKHALEMNAPYPEEKKSMEGPSWYDRIAKQKEREQVQGTDKLVVVSSDLKRYFVEGCEIGEDKVLITPNAINSSFGKDADGKAIREELQMGEGLVVGFVGSIFPYHGVDALIDAFSKLNAPESKLLIVGDGEILPELKIVAQERGIQDRVCFTGSVPHNKVASYIDAMDITVMATSNWYGSPVKIFEYGALGKAVIAPNNGPVNDVMKHLTDGFLITKKEELAGALNELNQDSKLRNKLANYWHKKVISNHTWKQVGMDILNHLNN